MPKITKFKRESDLTFEEASRLIDYNPDTGKLTWKVSRGPVRAGTPIDCTTRAVYVVVRIGYLLFYGHRLAWLLSTGEWPKAEIDHANGNPYDNRLENLREATSGQNKFNIGYVFNKTGYRGVSHHRNKFVAEIRKDGTKTYLGLFDTAEEASAAREAAEPVFYPDFARREAV